MINNGSADRADEKSTWTQPGFIAAAAVVAIIVLLGIILAFTGGSESDALAPTTPSPAPVSGTAPAADPDASACGLPPGSQSVPTATPRARWELVGQVAAPTAPNTVGPAKVERGLRSCFARSPKGALFAAVNVIAMTADPKRREIFVRNLTVPGIGRDRALAQRSSDAPNASTALQVVGFQIRDYLKDSAVVDLAFRVDTGNQAGTVHLPLAMRWLDGDWKLALPDTGQPFDGMARLPSTDGYIAWKGA